METQWRDLSDELGPSTIVLVRDPASGLEGVVVVDDVAAGPAIGGVRMASDVSVEEVARLARAMTLKNAAAGLPHGGGKAGIIGDPAVDPVRGARPREHARGPHPRPRAGRAPPRGRGGAGMGAYRGGPQLPPAPVAANADTAGKRERDATLPFCVLHGTRTVLRALRRANQPRPPGSHVPLRERGPGATLGQGSWPDVDAAACCRQAGTTDGSSRGRWEARWPTTSA